MTVPRASVIVPTHRGALRLPPLLEALSRQVVAVPWEVVVALDGVLDDTPAILRAYASRLPLRTLSAATRRGVCATLNDAYRDARGDVLIRCDDDLTPAPDMVTRHLAWHDASPVALGVIGATRDVFPDTSYARSYGRAANARQRSRAYGRSPDRLWVHWAAHNSVCREAWDRVGGFDPRFAYGEDSEVGLRLHRSGVRLLIDPQLEIEHREPAQTARARASRAFVAGASRRLFDVVHPDHRHAEAQPVGVRARAWNAAVAGTSTLLRSPEGFGRLGAVADRLPALVPDRLRGRITALAVESAGRSGHRHGTTDLASFQAQQHSHGRS
jgi:glycosyltransferase involved in cell wall biosynthesis